MALALQKRLSWSESIKLAFPAYLRGIPPKFVRETSSAKKKAAVCLIISSCMKPMPQGYPFMEAEKQIGMVFKTPTSYYNSKK